MRAGIVGGVLPGCLLALACGGDDASGGAKGGSASRGGNLPPSVQEVVLEPATPRPGERVTARVEVEDPEGDPVSLEYHWSIAGREVSASAGLRRGGERAPRRPHRGRGGRARRDR